MMRSLGGSLVLVAMLAAGCHSNCRKDDDCCMEDEHDVQMTLEQVPPAVRTTIEQHLNGGTIEELERSRDGDRTTYDVTVKGSGGTLEFEVGEDGAFLGADDEDDDDDADKD